LSVAVREGNRPCLQVNQPVLGWLSLVVWDRNGDHGFACMGRLAVRHWAGNRSSASVVAALSAQNLASTRTALPGVVAI
jgi:hypothetical protein